MNIKKFVWCLFLGRIYKENDDFTALIRKCIDLIENCQNSKVFISYFFIRIDTSSSQIELWNANKFYGWLSRGSVNGRSFSNGMPSKSVMYEFKECLKKHGYNIYQKQDNEIIDINDVKC